MNRYIYDIQYNKSDNSELYDRVWVDGLSKKESLLKLSKQFPGVYEKHLVKVEYNYN